MEAIFHKVASIKALPPNVHDSSTGLNGKYQIVVLYDSENRRVGQVVLHMKSDCRELRTDE